MLRLENRTVGLRATLSALCFTLVAAGSALISLLRLSGNPLVLQAHTLTLILSLLLGLIAGGLGWWLGGILTKPFAVLTDDIQKMKASHVYGSALAPTRFREVNPLISTLNSLFVDLARHREESMAVNESLERRVQERTLELVLINDSLQNEIEERRRLEDEREGLMASLVKLASIDHLTQTFNRRTLFQIGTEEFDRCRTLHLPLTVIMLDIDQFKQVNDKYGHAAGDEILHQVAVHLRRFVRDNDVIGRYGGEEFVFVLPDTSLEGALVVAERLRMGVLEASQLTSVGPQYLTASLGVATSLPAITDFSALVMQADHAHYAAKRGGKNQVSIAPQSLMAHIAPVAAEHLTASDPENTSSLERAGR